MVPLVALLHSDQRLSSAMARDMKVVQVRRDWGYLSEPLLELCYMLHLLPSEHSRHFKRKYLILKKDKNKGPTGKRFQFDQSTRE